MFHYFEEKEKVASYQKKYPEFAGIIQEYWERHTSISMAEVIPCLESLLTSKMGIPYTILEKITLKENSIKDILKGTDMYHLILSYYAVPKDKVHLLHHQIERGKKLWNYQLQKDGKKADLVLLNPNEIELKKEDGKKWKQLENEGRIFEIISEEKNIDIDDIVKPSTCIGVTTPLEQRKIIINPFSQDILSIIISYIEDKNNTSIKMMYQMPPEEMEVDLKDFLEKEKQNKSHSHGFYCLEISLYSFLLTTSFIQPINSSGRITFDKIFKKEALIR